MSRRREKIILSFLIVESFILSGIFFYLIGINIKISDKNKQNTNVATAMSPFLYTFNSSGRLNESGSMSDSHSPYWWLNSGGVMNINEGFGETNQGKMPTLSRWRILYNFSNPLDTDNGYYPQNIFRLVTKSKWQDFIQESYFKINKTNLSQSPNRNVSNGLLFFIRYLDGNNLYYAGIRVDGTAVIKKKINGEYFTLAQQKIFEGQYDRNQNPNLLPEDVWIGLRSEVVTNEDNSVSIKVFVKEQLEDWEFVLEAVDSGGQIIKEPILSEGFAGIRTDFMDVEFRNFKITKI